MTSMAEYRDMLKGVPRPTEVQIQAFSEHVASAHSWYKHLPDAPPGAPFNLYLDPAAGMQFEAGPDGTLTASDRAVQGFHYSWIPTARYLQQFGHLAFSRTQGTRVALLRADGTALVPSDDAPVVYDFRSCRRAELPEPVRQAGTVWLTGMIHEIYHPRRGYSAEFVASERVRQMDDLRQTASRMLDLCLA